MNMPAIVPKIESHDPLKIRIDGNTQPRAAISEETVAEYAQLIREGVAMPPVDVFFDGAEYWLADGFHRYHAVKAVGAGVEIDAYVHHGTRRDAVLFSVGANTEHGLRRTNADKRKAVVTLLSDAEWRVWGNVEIGRRCSVSDELVRVVRNEMNARSAEPSSNEWKIETRKVERGGKVYEQNVSNIGRAPRMTSSNTQARRDMGIEGAPDSLLKNRKHRNDDAFMSNLIGALQGIAIGMNSRDTSTLSSNDLAPQWIADLEEFATQLRAFIRPIKNGGN